MNWIELESEAGYYDTFMSESGDKYVALRGLDPRLVHSPSGIEAFMLEHYDFFALVYWGLIVALFVYLAGTYFIIPLYLRHKRNLPLFSEQ